MKKHSHPLKLTCSSLYDIINGKVANASLNVQETLKIGESMLLDFRSSLSGGFHAPLIRKVKTMDSIKCGVATDDKTLYDMPSLLCRLITVGQHRQVELQTLLDYELCAVPASSIGEYGCLRTGTKSTLVSKLKLDDLQPDVRHSHRRWPTTAISHCSTMCCFRSRQQYEGQTRSVPTNRSADHLRSL